MARTKKNFVQLMGLSLIIYPLAFFNQILMSNYFGTSFEVDAYWIAISIVNLLGFYIQPAKEAFIPEFFKHLKLGKKIGSQYFSEAGNFLLILILLSSLLLYLFPSFFAGLLVSDQQHLLQKTTLLLPYVLPLVSLFAITEILNGILVSYNKVFFQNIGRLLGVLFSIFFLLVFAKQLQIKAVIFSAVLAAFVLFFIQWKELHKVDLHYRFLTIPRVDDQFRKMLSALLLIYAYSQLNAVIERKIFSFFGEGIISAYQYANSISHIPQNIIVMALTTVLWPKFLELSQAENKEQLFLLTAKACKILAILLTFISLFTWIFANDIVFILYYRGAFNEKSLLQTTLCLRALIITICPLGISLILSRVLISLQKAKSMIIAGVGVTSGSILVLLVGRWIEVLEVSIFHLIIGATLGCFLLAIMFLRYIKSVSPDTFKYRKAVFWTVRLISLNAFLYIIYPVSKFENIGSVLSDKTLLFGGLVIHFMFLTIVYGILLIVLKLIPCSDIIYSIGLIKEKVFK